MWSQVGLRKHHYKQRQWRWWDSSWAISNPKRWCCESAALNMPANLENSLVATGPEKVSFHSNPKERQCQRVLRLPHNALIPHASKVMQPRQHTKKQRRCFANKGPTSQSYGFPSSHVWMWELEYKESWVQKNWSFWAVMLEKTLESPLDCKEIKPVNPKKDQSWIFIGRTDAEAETPIL